MVDFHCTNVALVVSSPVYSESARNSKRSKLRTEMIGAPQNDLRHTGHIGYDGAVFGDVSFIGDNYDKLPVKVGASGESAGLWRENKLCVGVCMCGCMFGWVM